MMTCFSVLLYIGEYMGLYRQVSVIRRSRNIADNGNMSYI